MERTGLRQLRHRWQNLAIFYLFWVPLGVVFIEAVREDYIRWGMVVFVTAFVVLTAWPIAFIADMLIPIHASAEGLVCYNSFGLRRVIPWDRITGAKRMTIFPGLNYLAVLDGTSYFSRGLIVRFANGKREFFEDVKALAGEEHPLTIALRREGFDKAEFTVIDDKRAD